MIFFYVAQQALCRKNITDQCRFGQGNMKTRSKPPASERNAKIKNVIRVSSGNFLEMYDFIVFGYYAAPIGRTFFPDPQLTVGQMAVL